METNTYEIFCYECSTWIEVSPAPFTCACGATFVVDPTYKVLA